MRDFALPTVRSLYKDKGGALNRVNYRGGEWIEQELAMSML